MSDTASTSNEGATAGATATGATAAENAPVATAAAGTAAAEATAGATASATSRSAFIQDQGKKDLFILRQLVSKDFKLKYRRSFLGVVWSVLNPLLMMIVMSLVFSFFLRFGDIPHYPLYLIIGNITWTVFSDSTNAGVVSIIDAASLLKKVRVNKAVFPTERVLFSLVNFLFSLVAVLLVMVWEGVWPTFYLLLLPVGLALLMVFCIGVSLLISALAVFFRDVIHLWSVLLLAWMYATPIFWPVTMIESVPYAAVRFLMLVNPMYNYITFIRNIFINAMMPSPVTWGMCVLWSVVAIALGGLVFKKMQRKFILYI